MWCVVLRDSNMAELVLWKEEGADQEICCWRDPQCEQEKLNRRRGALAASTSPLKISTTSGRIRLPANSLLPKHPSPKKSGAWIAKGLL